MRGVYTSGVLEAFDEAGLRFDSVVACSAGAGASYLAGQTWRHRRVYLDFLDGNKLVRFGHLFTGGNVMDIDYFTDEVTLRLCPLDLEALRASDTRLHLAVALYVSGMAFGRAGEHDWAIEALTRISEISGRVSYYLGVLGWAFGNAGREDEARSLLDELHERAKSEYVGPMLFASIHSGLREKDQAMEWLSRAVENRSPIRVWLEFPLFDNLRDDPRFSTLQHRLGLR